MNLSTHSRGQQAEKTALEFLQGKGLILIEQNYRCFCGEIDLIMQDKEIIVFVEVRSRNRIDFGSATDTVTKTKRRKIIKAATFYLQRKKWLYKRHSRFDLIAIHPVEGILQLDWIKNAFSSY